MIITFLFVVRFSRIRSLFRWAYFFVNLKSLKFKLISNENFQLHSIHCQGDWVLPAVYLYLSVYLFCFLLVSLLVSAIYTISAEHVWMKFYIV